MLYANYICFLIGKKQEVVTGISDTHEACTCCECTMKFWNSEMETVVNCYKFAGRDYVHKFCPNNILNEQYASSG